MGHTLIQWIEEERYLPKTIDDNEIKLLALRRFWTYLHGMYRYKNVVGHNMQLKYTPTEDQT